MPMNAMKRMTAQTCLVMTIKLDLQKATRVSPIPSKQQFQNWVKAALAGRRENAELTIRIVDEKEAKDLNEKWRKSKGATNVLSFSIEDARDFIPDLLGDIVICAPVVQKEADMQCKPVESHWAHLVIHGTLHLLGYDHIKTDEAEKMEEIEIKILGKLGYNNPYEATKGP